MEHPAFASGRGTPAPVLQPGTAWHAKHSSCYARRALWTKRRPAARAQRSIACAVGGPASASESVPACRDLLGVGSDVEVVDVFNTALPPPPTVAGRGAEPKAVVIVPGYGSDADRYGALARAVARVLGPAATVRVAPVRWYTWVRTVGGLPVTAVLEAIDAAVDDALAESGASRVTVVGHSAGGWIARIWLSRNAAYHGTVWAGADRANRLICLGTPQTSAEPVTQRNMLFVAEACADCAEAPDVEYICLCGSGVGIPETALTDRWSKFRFWDSNVWMARISYEITAGPEKAHGARIGDGIVPTAVAFLDGARNVILDGVWHSPTSPGPWYGDPRAVAYWCQFLL